MTAYHDRVSTNALAVRQDWGTVRHFCHCPTSARQRYALHSLPGHACPQRHGERVEHRVGGCSWDSRQTHLSNTRGQGECVQYKEGVFERPPRGRLVCSAHFVQPMIVSIGQTTTLLQSGHESPNLRREGFAPWGITGFDDFKHPVVMASPHSAMCRQFRNEPPHLGLTLMRFQPPRVDTPSPETCA